MSKKNKGKSAQPAPDAGANTEGQTQEQGAEGEQGQQAPAEQPKEDLNASVTREAFYHKETDFYVVVGTPKSKYLIWLPQSQFTSFELLDGDKDGMVAVTGPKRSFRKWNQHEASKVETSDRTLIVPDELRERMDAYAASQTEVQAAA